MKDIDIFIQGKNYARAIRDKKIEIMNLSALNKVHLDTMLQTEGEILFEVNLEHNTVNGRTKKVYGNEALRQAELRKRLDANDEYNDTKMLVSNNNIKIDEFHIGLQFSQNMLNLLIAFLR